MSEKTKVNRQETNKVWVSGIIEEEFEYSHTVLREKFYKNKIGALRLSGSKDYIPIIISYRLISEELNDFVKGKYAEISGQFRSYNRVDAEGKNRVELFLFATTINIYEDREQIEQERDSNLVYLDGFICRPPVFRLTPFGRQITDLLLAVNREHKKSDYIPCISWGRTAKYLSTLNVGSRIKIEGRIQSREYFKRYSADSEKGEYKTAYEISITDFVEIEDELSDD